MKDEDVLGASSTDRGTSASVIDELKAQSAVERSRSAFF